MQKQDSGFDRTPPFPRGSSRTHATVLTKKQWMRCGKGLTSNLRRLCLHPKEQYPAALAWLGPSRDQPGCMGCTLYDMVVGSGTSPNYMTLQSKTRHANRASQHSKRLKIEFWQRHHQTFMDQKGIMAVTASPANAVECPPLVLRPRRSPGGVSAAGCASQASTE